MNDLTSPELSGKRAQRRLCETIEVMAPSEGSRAVVELLGRVKAAWPPGRWEWDGRFGCALTTVNKDTETAGQAALTAQLGEAWTRKTLEKAPPLVQQVCNGTGGLKGAQLAFAAAIAEVVVYALWWPWGDGATISVRVGVVSGDASRNLAPEVRAAFGV
jgi:hypothetical protein